MTKSFGSQIRGGESSCRVRLSTRPVLNPGGTLDVAVALNWDDFLKFGAELPVGGRHGRDLRTATAASAPTGCRSSAVTPAEVLPVPISEMARQTAGSERAKNIVVLGLLSGWFGIGGESHPAAASARSSRKKGAEGRRGERTRLRGRSRVRRDAPAARAPRRWNGRPARPPARSCSPTATRCAPPPPSSPAASSSAAIRSRRRPKSCSS